MRRLRIGMAQVNTTVGDFSGNTAAMRRVIDDARAKGVDLVVFPELATCGYPPEDLLLKRQFVDENLTALDAVTEATSGITAVVGFVDGRDELYNAAAVVHNGKLSGVYHKVHLPNYGVYDENRYFKPGCRCPVFVIGGVKVGVNICEDIWYEDGPASVQAHAGAEVIVNISGSPYHYGKWENRQRMLSQRANQNIAYVIYSNMVGGQDELVFDGNSMAFDGQGKLVARGKPFSEDLVVVDVDADAIIKLREKSASWKAKEKAGEQIIVSEELFGSPKPPLEPANLKAPRPPAEVYDALVMGTRDYILKNGFKGVTIGLSGGIDSSLVAAVAVDALGAESVTGVIMPSTYSSEGSVRDAVELAQNLGIKVFTIPIEKPRQAYLDSLKEIFGTLKADTTEENIQARIRGNLLMALSNKFGWLVLTTGNKSEYATGYTTLYGDMAGGFAVIKDVYKIMVYKLARYRNKLDGGEVIPAGVISKEPSAELRPGQKDTDYLPPYAVLDPILKAYVEDDMSTERIIGMGFNKDVVQKVARLVDGSEYKRRQAPPGVKITPKAFGRDRRLPITNRFRS